MRGTGDGDQDKFSIRVCLITVSEQKNNEQVIASLQNVSGELTLPCEKAADKQSVFESLKKIREKHFLPNSFEGYDSVSKILSIIDTDDNYQGKEKKEISIVFMDYLKEKIEKPEIKWLTIDEIFDMNESGTVDPFTWHVLKRCFSNG